MITLLFGLWYAEIAVKAVAAYRLYRTRLIREFPVLFIFLITSAAKSIILVQLRHAPAAYATVYSISIPVMLILQFLCGIEVFERLTSRHANFERIGRIFLAVFAMAGVAASIVTQHIGVPATWYGVREAAVLMNRYGLSAFFIGLILMVLFVPRVRSLAVPRNAHWAAMIMGFYVLGNAVCAMLLVGSSAAWRLVPAYVTVITGLIAAVGWTTLLKSRIELRPPPADGQAADRAWRQYVRFIGALRAHATH